MDDDVAAAAVAAILVSVGPVQSDEHVDRKAATQIVPLLSLCGSTVLSLGTFPVETTGALFVVTVGEIRKVYVVEFSRVCKGDHSAPLANAGVGNRVAENMSDP